MIKPLQHALFSTLVLFASMTGAQAAELDLMRSVPLEISAYTEAANFPETFTKAEEVMAVINSPRSYLLHMEALRRSHFDLAPAEKARVSQLLHARYKASPEDAGRFFDYGYAELVYDKNKTALFFLRKASERLKNPFVSMAYAMGQAEIDLNQENSTPTEMTTRKMDVMHRFQDAVAMSAENPKPGFWPSFVRVVKQLDGMPAYLDLTTADHSSSFVPYGSLTIPPVSTQVVGGAAPVTAPVGACTAATAFTVPAGERLINTRLVDFQGKGQPLLVHVYDTGTPSQYRVMITDPEKKQLVGSFLSGVAQSIIEDLERDGTFEFVIRQGKIDPYNPVLVYRLVDGCQFELDADIAKAFK